MKSRAIVTYSYIIIEAVLCALIFVNPFDKVSLYSYFSIIVNFIYALTFIKFSSNKKVLLLQIGLFATLVADFFLVLIGLYKNVAMTSFLLTQISYSLFLLEYSQNKKRDIFIRIIGSILIMGITIIVLKEKSDYLSIISMLYFFNLFYSMLLSIFSNVSLLFKWGLVLFICCDILIGFENAIGGYLDVSDTSFIYKITHLGFNLAWVFYLPSQALISLTLNDLSTKKD